MKKLKQEKKDKIFVITYRVSNGCRMWLNLSEKVMFFESFVNVLEDAVFGPRDQFQGSREDSRLV
jgi:hypothetical protein